MKKDEFGKTGIDDLRQRFDNFLVELENDPNSTGYILSYGAKKEIDERKEFCEVHLTQRKFSLDRVVFPNGGKEKIIRTRFWRVPAGADASTVD
jgi:hypothetical protein